MLRSPNFNLNKVLENWKNLRNVVRTDQSCESIIKSAMQIEEEIDVEPTYGGEQRRKSVLITNALSV